MIYRYKIIPRSPLITALMSDTIFGHFCWAIRYREGEDYLTDFLNSYGEGRPAPVLFSTAFLSDHLPRPTIPSMSRERIKRFVHKHFGEGKKAFFEGMSKIKAWSKIRTISIEQWLSLNDDYSDERLYERFLQNGCLADEGVFGLEVSSSNMISRVSGSVPHEGGGLFQREKLWYHKGVILDIYAEVNQDEVVDMTKWFLIDYLPESGFGADKSIGMGSLSIAQDTSFNPDKFIVQDPNARLSVSFAVFPEIEKYDSFYRLKTKFGKLGGSFATVSPTGGNPRPFKKPIMMYEPGAVFFCKDSLNDKPLLKNIHSDSRICQCGVPITLPFKIREDENHGHEAT